MKHFLILALCIVANLSAVKAAESYIAVEAHTGRVLLAENSEQKRPVASLTKIATGKVVLDWARRSGKSMADLVVVPDAALRFGGPNPMSLQVGDRLSLRDALYSALMGSDNIAAYTLAEHVGGHILQTRGRSGNAQEAFVREMNRLAKSLGMRRTKFFNPHGLELPKSKGYSTAADMARLSIYAMRDEGFVFYVKQKSRKVAVVSVNDQRRSFTVGNTNKLLGKLGINGIKTGLTNAAGQCLAVNAHRSPIVKKIDEKRSEIRKRDVVVVVLGSADRFARARQLVTQSWPIYDQWAAKGYPVSAKGRELLSVPQL